MVHTKSALTVLAMALFPSSSHLYNKASKKYGGGAWEEFALQKQTGGFNQGVVPAVSDELKRHYMR